MKWFASRGHKQVLAGFYDAPPENFIPWMKDAAKIDGIIGMMYTTWARDFTQLDKFAKVAREGK